MKKHVLNVILRQLIPNVGTILVVALMLFAYRAGAAPDTNLQTAPVGPNITPGIVRHYRK